MKKLSKIQKLVITFVAAIALAVPVALAQSTGSGEGSQKRHHAKMRMGKHRGQSGAMLQGRFMRSLELTDAQKAQMKQIRQSNRESLKPLREQLRAIRQEVRQSTQSGTFDEAFVTRKLTEAASLQAKLMGAQFNAHQETLSALTPEQKTRLDEMRAQFKAKQEERKAKRQERRGRRSQ